VKENMNALIRPRLATGVALVGAAAIAMSPVVVSPSDTVDRLTVAAPQIQLNAIDNPFPLWEAITQQALGSLQQLVNEYLADPVPVLRQIAANQTESLTELAMLATTYVASLGTAIWNTPADVLEILGDLQAGNGGAALEKLAATLMTPINLTAKLGADAFPILVRPIDRLLGLGTAIPAVISPIVDAIMIGASTFIMSVAGTADDVWHNVKKLDVDGAINALLTGLAVIPATALGLVAAPLQGLIEASHVIASVLRSIDPPPGLPTSTASQVPDEDAPTVTVDVVDEDPAPEDEVLFQKVALTDEVEDEDLDLGELDEAEELDLGELDTDLATDLDALTDDDVVEEVIEKDVNEDAVEKDAVEKDVNEDATE
jgi:hypothetical protein